MENAGELWGDSICWEPATSAAAGKAKFAPPSRTVKSILSMTAIIRNVMEESIIHIRQRG